MEVHMEFTQLGTPILRDGIQSINFFNGRLLSGEDLSQEQVANLQARQLLGKAIGDGIVYGLQVTQTLGVGSNQSPVLTISPGLALNRDGNPLQLKSSVDVALVPPPQGSSGIVNALFADCRPPQQGPSVTGKGVYLLTIQAASGKEGRAPVSGLGNLDAACNARYNTDGVQFRLIQLSVPTAELADAPHLRNILAYRCFGSYDADVTSFFANPFGPIVDQYGLLDDLRADCLRDDEVPLALLYWTSTTGIEFIDLWSVRRRVTQRAANANWQVLVSDRMQAEGEARYFQFEGQIENIRIQETNLMTSVAAVDHFKFLPPVGFLPITGTNSPSGFDKNRFFGSLASNDVSHIDARLLREFLHDSFFHQPIDTGKTEKIQLYWIHENVTAVQQQQVPQLVLVFASAALADHDVARFGRAKWGRNRFA
jgi:hypothetical protein